MKSFCSRSTAFISSGFSPFCFYQLERSITRFNFSYIFSVKVSAFFFPFFYFYWAFIPNFGNLTAFSVDYYFRSIVFLRVSKYFDLSSLTSSCLVLHETWFHNLFGFLLGKYSTDLQMIGRDVGRDQCRFSLLFWGDVRISLLCKTRFILSILYNQPIKIKVFKKSTNTRIYLKITSISNRT